MSNEARAFICGCAGTELTVDERALFAKTRPWGLILFKRNVEDRAQLIRLTQQFREIVGRADAPVLIDQEGGRVQRMGPPLWRKYPPAGAFAAAGHDAAATADLIRTSAQVLAADLKDVGITVDCLPVVDVPGQGAHNIIGDRAYAADPDTVAAYGRAACEGVLAAGVLPVIKHMPGHGRARADSHLELPVVEASLADLEGSDFVPFRALADMPLAMSAHVVYTAIDSEWPATVSAKVVSQVMRGHIGFQGLIMSDDLSMKALKGSFTEKTEALFAAGLDLALHCQGEIADGYAVANASPILDGVRLERAEKALAAIAGPPRPFDPVDAWARVQSGLAMTA
ncbi:MULTISPECIES: beta-N-acetylhexosaminidase [unclassified Beijerinckia]|uniref:beta-N-acetylhexosaminidase n=1 Tax=unclassified Beijerinckia TaxID=2638183 RepID=UPI000894A23F|nr:MULTISPECIES: beta-N-acetylhexosaminidase [unclassified Beijerinckia]MDH7795648.1 beta-N-acetylhexosaminidase [Beijerinckia sp. GAS462]SEC10160.1 beta-N-acetylhexosaminidase [Beijerinckia sp. 28-YEA-48]